MIALLVTGVSRGGWFDRLGTSFRSITWNAMNQLTAVTKNAVTQASYSYDPDGRRVEKLAGATTTGWAYDREDILRQNVTTAAVLSTTRFIHGPGIDEPMAQENVTTDDVTYLHSDALGSVARHTSASAAVTETIAYDAWGSLQAGSPTLYAFTGREWDATVGLYYYRARYYDSSRGRFLGEDPITDSTFTPNLAQYWTQMFAYAANRPTVLTDPTGFAPQGCTDVCVRAKAEKLDAGDGGGVICCGGGKYACGWPDPISNAKAATFVQTCSEEHEKDHFGDVTCPPCNNNNDVLTRPGYNRGKSKKTEECSAYRVSLKCLTPKQQNCNGDVKCLDVMKVYLDHYQKQATKNCK